MGTCCITDPGIVLEYADVVLCNVKNLHDVGPCVCDLHFKVYPAKCLGACRPSGFARIGSSRLRGGCLAAHAHAAFVWPQVLALTSVALLLVDWITMFKPWWLCMSCVLPAVGNLSPTDSLGCRLFLYEDMKWNNLSPPNPWRVGNRSERDPDGVCDLPWWKRRRRCNGLRMLLISRSGQSYGSCFLRTSYVRLASVYARWDTRPELAAPPHRGAPFVGTAISDSARPSKSIVGASLSALGCIYARSWERTSSIVDTVSR